MESFWNGRSIQSLSVSVAGLLVFSSLPAFGVDDTVAGFITQLASSDRNVRREASLQLGSVGRSGRDAVPALIKALDDDDKQVWSNALSALANLGPDASEAIPSLVQSLGSRGSKGGGYRDRERRQSAMRAAFALSRIGQAAIAPLINALNSPDDSTLRAGAARALAGMGPLAKPAIPALVGNLGHDEFEVRRAAVEALGEIGVDALEPLTTALASPEMRVRESGVLGLAALGASVSAPSAPAVLAMFKGEPEFTVRTALYTALPSLSVDSATALPLLLEGVNAQNDLVRRAALNALLLMNQTHAAIVPTLTGWLADPALNVRGAGILGRIGAAGAPAVPALIEAMLRNESAPYIEALSQIGPRAVPAIMASLGNEEPEAISRERWSGLARSFKLMGGSAAPALSGSLTDPKVTVRLMAAQALGEIGNSASSAGPALLKSCNDADLRVRIKSLGALMAVRADSRAILPKIESALRDPVPASRAAALEMIPALGDKAKPLSAAILDALKDTDPRVRRLAIDAVGPIFPQATPALINALSEPALQGAVFDALARIGPEAQSAAPRLNELLAKSEKPARLRILTTLSKTGATTVDEPLRAALKDSDADIRAAALNAYVRAEPHLPAAAPLLMEAAGDADLKVRLAAIEALGVLATRSGNKEIPEALPPLFALLRKNEERATVLEALRHMNVQSLPPLLEALGMAEQEVRIFACERLGALGKPAAEALPALRAILENPPNDDIRRAARRAVFQIAGTRSQ